MESKCCEKSKKRRHRPLTHLYEPSKVTWSTQALSVERQTNLAHRKSELLMWNIREQLCSAQRSERGIFQRKCANWLVDTSHVCKAMWLQWRLFGKVNLVKAWQPIKTRDHRTGVLIRTARCQERWEREAVKWQEENRHFHRKGEVKINSEEPVL